MKLIAATLICLFTAHGAAQVPSKKQAKTLKVSAEFLLAAEHAIDDLDNADASIGTVAFPIAFLDAKKSAQAASRCAKTEAEKNAARNISDLVLYIDLERHLEGVSNPIGLEHATKGIIAARTAVMELIGAHKRSGIWD